MKIEYMGTLDELIDTHTRQMNRSKTVKRWKWQGLVVTSLLLGVGTFLAVPEPMPVRLGFGTFSLILSVVTYLWFYPASVYRRLRKFLLEQVGGGPFPCSIEISEAGIGVNVNSTQVRFDWANVRGIFNFEDSFEVSMKDGGLVVVRKRIFSSSDEYRMFEESVRAFTQGAKEL